MSLAQPWELGWFVDFEDGDEISHVVGSGQQKPNPQPSWKKFWLAHSGKQWPDTCRIYNCGNPINTTATPGVGAHIYIKKQGLQQNFILPTCNSCNQDHRYFYGNGYCSPNVGARAVWVDRDPNTF